MRSIKYRTVFFNKLDGKFIEQWRELWAISQYSSFINSPVWFLSALKSFGYKDYVVIAIYKGENLVAVAPLVKEKKYALSVYTTPGDYIWSLPFLIDYSDKKAVSELVERLLSLGNSFLDETPEPLIDAIEMSTKNIDCFLRSVNYLMVFEKDKNGQVVIRKRRKRLRRVRNIEHMFSLQSYKGFTEESLKKVFDIDGQSRKRSRGYSAFYAKRNKDFFKSLAHELGENFRVNILLFNDEPIAYEIGFISKSTYYGNQMSFVQKYEGYAPGKVIVVKLIDSLGLTDIKTMEFGSGETPLKIEFSNKQNYLFKAIISRNIFVRLYIKLIYSCQYFFYEDLKRRKRTYIFYCILKRLLTKKNTH